jgi:hypothetical protein
MCFAKRFGTENVSGNEWIRKSRKFERRTDDDVAAVALPRDQAPAVSPVEQVAAATLGDTVELSSQSADVGEPHHPMLAGPRACPSTERTY